jgi:ABC-type cobalamin/Fe3+-siderophores transport system ATPase subunit
VAPLIAVEDIHVGYGARAVLSGASATVAAGEIVAIVGPNGAGKTTLLRAIAGLIAPRAGAVRVFGVDPARTPRRALARRLAYLPQRYELAFPFTVGEVVLMGRYARAGRLRLESAADLAMARAAMERCDVAGLEDRRFDTLSGGEQRRTLLAQAFCQEAELLLLDEPTAALDPAHARALFTALVAERDRGAAAVVVTHDLNAAVRWADRALILAGGTADAAAPPGSVTRGGAIVADGAPAAVLSSPAAARAFAIDIHVGALPSGARFAVPA